MAILFIASIRLSSLQAKDLQAIPLTERQQRIVVTNKALIFFGRGDNLRVNTASDNYGVRRLMSIPAEERGSNPTWYVFALRNATNKPITRWLVSARYDMVGSGIIWPDLDSNRIRAVTPSVGFVPQRVENEGADIFQITIQPGQTVTYVAELESKRASIDLWSPLSYELYIRDKRLFDGIMLGVTGLLGVFLTAVFAANHKMIFPSAALVTWSVLAYLCVDFGFWHKLLQLHAEDTAVYRAATEASMASSLAVFLYTFLRLGAWHIIIRMLALVWIIAAMSLIFVAVIDPRLASTFARLSFAGLGSIGGLVILFLAVRGQDRALSLIPTWLLFLVWLFGVSTTLSGQLKGDVVVTSLVAGLTLIVVLLGFTVTQFAFATRESNCYIGPHEQSTRSLAIDGAGAAVWDWNAKRQEIKVSPIVESRLGLQGGELSGKVSEFLKYVHSDDRDRFRLQLAFIHEQNSGVIKTDLRMRQCNGRYRWFKLDAASVHTPDARFLRCVGLIRDITEMKNAQERLMRNAVRDKLTGLPNRELFFDRYEMLLQRALNEDHIYPKVICIAIKKLKGACLDLNTDLSDILIVTLVKRLRSHISQNDTLGRLDKDQFAILIHGPIEVSALQQLADDLQRSIRTPIRVVAKDFVLSAAIGVAVSNVRNDTLIKDAEAAMQVAKQQPGEQVVFFQPEMRKQLDVEVDLINQFEHALNNNQLEFLFQPIVDLAHEELAGFEAFVRWKHKKHGFMLQKELWCLADKNGLTLEFGIFLLKAAMKQAAKWQKEFPCNKKPLFLSISVNSSTLFSSNFAQEICQIVSQDLFPEGVLRIGISEKLLMENPEQSIKTLEDLNKSGFRIELDDFGEGLSYLKYMKYFSIDTVKINGELISACSGSERHSNLVRAIVAFVHKLGKEVSAQGVDFLEDAKFLHNIKCEYAQGFYYGEVMTFSEVYSLLKSVRKSERIRYRTNWLYPKPSEEGSKPPKSLMQGNTAIQENNPASNILSVSESPHDAVTNVDYYADSQALINHDQNKEIDISENSSLSLNLERARDQTGWLNNYETWKHEYCPPAYNSVIQLDQSQKTEDDLNN
ncbi:MAG: sensor domain-containing phosphodiesterase, partial [Hyphomicrobiaceae bacterium]|nr:sensor domain-containing phosphodiesterase [Hyphomicrobiaceae bacterium]